jgi:hypothetical protein
VAFGARNEHIYDSRFFHLNIRANAKARVSVYLTAQQTSGDDDA